MKVDTVVDDTSGKGIDNMASTVSKLFEDFSRLANQLMAIGTVAEITTVVPLSPDLTDDLQKKIFQLTGKNVLLRTFIDKSILGGMIVRIGDKVIDLSVRRRLEKLKEKLVSDKGLGSDVGNL